MSPNKERIRLWVEDLRKPGLTQAVGALRSSNNFNPKSGKYDAVGFCCLGRASEVAIANGCNVTIETTDDRDINSTYADTYPDSDAPLPNNRSGSNSSATSLTRNVQEWFGFDVSDPAIAPAASPDCEEGAGCKVCSPGVIRATNANDNLKWSFAQIADAVEALYLSDDSEVTSDAGEAEA